MGSYHYYFIALFVFNDYLLNIDYPDYYYNDYYDYYFYHYDIYYNYFFLDEL
jgi:hypothetical protein